MSAERDELAEVIARRRYAKNARPSVWITGRAALEVAESILAAGYRKPRTITTVEERDALPAGVLLKDSARMLWQLTTEGQWRVSGGASQWLSMEPVDMEFPATVLYEPS